MQQKEGYHEPYLRTHEAAQRVTLMPPGTTHRSPLDHCKASAETSPQPNLYRFAHQNLGFIEQQFEDKVTNEIDELMWEAQVERLLACLTLPSTSNMEPPPRILTKDDYLSLFRATCIPTSGPLLGIYRWAADLGHAQYNFTEELEEHNFHLLNAYD